jgi:phosphoribosylanthranilate isomerase
MTVKVKICGVNTEAAVDAAVAAGADYLGLVSYAKSPRYVELPLAQRLAAHARTKSAVVQIVVLMVDDDDRRLRQWSEGVKPDLIQLHGKETPDRVGLVAATTGRQVMKAIAVSSQADVAAAAAYLAPGKASLVLFDAKPPSDPNALPGGNGLSFDWRMLSAWDQSKPFMLAGGLTPDNVANAIRLTGAPIVDVSSGVESTPGVKDADLIRRFIQAAKTAKQRA